MSARALCLVAVILSASGCAPLQGGSQKSTKLPQTKLSSDAVMLDVAFVRLPAADAKRYDAIWNAADEQHFPGELRALLATNGLRAGIYGQELPGEIRELLAPQPNRMQQLTEEALNDLEIGGTRQQLPLRAGHRSVIKASAVYPSLPVLLSEDGSVRGHQLTDARCVLALKVHPLGDGRVKLAVTPEIEHGESKTRFAGSEGMIIPQTSQDRLVLDRLRLEALLNPGQTLILSTTPEIKGLGECYFSHRRSGAVERRLLLIRFTMTQFDDLFAPEQTSAPLTTPAD